MSGNPVGSYHPPDLTSQSPAQVKEKPSNDFDLLDIDFNDLGDDRKEQDSSSMSNLDCSNSGMQNPVPHIQESSTDEIKAAFEDKGQVGTDEDINANNEAEEIKEMHSGVQLKNDLEEGHANIVHSPKPTWYEYLTIDYYKQYFNVTTMEMVERMKKAVFPLYGGSIFDGGEVDLYGPIWIIITLNITITVFGNMAKYIKFVTQDESDDYSSEIKSLVKSVPLITLYFLAVPLIVSLIIRIGGSGKISYFYLLSIYGYSFASFIPATFLYIIPSWGLKWLVLFAAAAISLFFITKELYQMVSQNLDDYKLKVVGGIMLGGHIIFILLMRLSFLH